LLLLRVLLHDDAYHQRIKRAGLYSTTSLHAGGGFKKCSYCGKCARSCPMGARTVDTKGKTRSFESIRCVGCGLCYIACDKEKAIELKPVLGYEPPTVIKVERVRHPLAGISGIEKDDKTRTGL